MRLYLSKKVLAIVIVLLFSQVVMLPIKIDAELTAIHDVNCPHQINNHILVKYRDSKKFEDLKASVSKRIKSIKLTLKKKIKSKNIELLELNEPDNIEKVIAEFKQDPNIEYAQPDYIYRASELPSDPYFYEQWGLNNTSQNVFGSTGNSGIDVDSILAWNITTGNQNTLVGVVDSGIDINHPDLYENIDTTDAWDFYHNDGTVYDSSINDSHGTHVAGIIAGKSNNKGICGVAPNVRILPLKFLENGEGTTTAAIEAIAYAKSKGVRIINCSWGGSYYDQALYDEMNDPDILFICAAGNQNMNTNTTPTYPASFNLPNIISVAAVDNTGKLSSFSNYGTNIDVAAPGTNILSTYPENKYVYLEGTSMATPFVTGIAALIKSCYPNETSAQIKRRIIESVAVNSKLNGKVASGGIVDASNALSGASSSIGIPLNVTATPSGSALNINWTAVNGADSYQVGVDGVILNNSSSTTYTHSGLAAASKHQYRIRALSSGVPGKWSNMITGTTLSATPLPPPMQTPMPISTSTPTPTPTPSTVEVVEVAKIILDITNTTITVGQTEQLTATVDTTDATDMSVTWSVYSQSGNNLVTVSATGLVTAINPGTAVIRATSTSDATKYDECIVKVNDDESPLLGSVEGFIKMEGKSAERNSGISIKIDGTSRETKTDASGYFIIKGITPGKITLDISEMNYLERQIAGVTISAGQVNTLSTNSNYILLWAGDFDGEAGIGGPDLNVLLGAYGKINGQAGYYGNADFDEKNGIGPSDLNILISHYGKTSSNYPVFSGFK